MGECPPEHRARTSPSRRGTATWPSRSATTRSSCGCSRCWGWTRRGATRRTPERVTARQELVAWLSAAIEQRRRDELVEALRAADVPAGPVASVGEALRSMEAAHDGHWVQEASPMRLAPDPIRLDGESPPLRGVPPLLGEHTDDVLTELGLSPAEIATLRRDGVVA